VIIGYAYVVGDIINIGHLKHLQACKGLCDKLIVGVLTDGATIERKEKPIISFGERLETVKNIKFVDVVVKQETYSPLPNVEALRPDILFESASHKEYDIQMGESLMARLGGRLIVLPYYAGQSSTAIKNKILKRWKYKDKLHPEVINLEKQYETGSNT